jgi:hypothetical protein
VSTDVLSLIDDLLESVFDCGVKVTVGEGVDSILDCADELSVTLEIADTPELSPLPDPCLLQEVNSGVDSKDMISKRQIAVVRENLFPLCNLLNSRTILCNVLIIIF